MNKEYPLYALQMTWQGSGGELMSNLELASERVSLQGKPQVSSKVNLAFESDIRMGNVLALGKLQ